MKKKKIISELLALGLFSCVVAGLIFSRVHIVELEKTIENQKGCIEDLSVIQDKLNDKLEKLNAKYKDIEKHLKDVTKDRDKLHEEIDQMNEKVQYNSQDLRESSNTTPYHLYKMLKGTELHSLAPYFCEAEKQYGVNAIALASILAHESAWGTKTNYENNLSGFAVYNRGGGATFDSKEDNILATAKLLSENYLNPKGKNFHGTSLEAVNTDYCLLDNGHTDWKWSESINQIAQSLENKANQVG